MVGASSVAVQLDKAASQSLSLTNIELTTVAQRRITTVNETPLALALAVVNVGCDNFCVKISHVARWVCAMRGAAKAVVVASRSSWACMCLANNIMHLH